MSEKKLINRREFVKKAGQAGLAVALSGAGARAHQDCSGGGKAGIRTGRPSEPLHGPHSFIWRGFALGR